LSTSRRTVEHSTLQWENLHSMSQPPSDPPRAGTTPWHIVVPVKRADLGKSRLAQSLGRAAGSAEREALSRALASDTVRAARLAVGPEQVWVVTSDERFGAECLRQGVRVVQDTGRGLNAAISEGLAAAGRPSVGALLGDLPALTAADLASALMAAAALPQAFVPDAAGTGTVLRTAMSPSSGPPRAHASETPGGPLALPFVPRFGPDSAARHEADGATRLDLPLPRLRTDVDDLESLGRAAELGLGPATREAVESIEAIGLLGWAHAGDGPRV
jgi:2-phospho-L-lactate guanylyltransferase